MWNWIAGLAGALLLIWAFRSKPRYNRPLVEVRAPEPEPEPEPEPRAEDKRSSLVWVAISGGGTRAAALGASVLEALARIPFPGAGGRVSNLAAEIDVISGISGGSFAATAWCLGRGVLTAFRRSFLEKNIERRILLSLLHPLRLPRLVSPNYSRIHVAAELYDRKVFHGGVFGDLPARPELRIHATHLALGSRLSFSEEDFRKLGSDLASYPLGYACAASSAFPVLLSPMTLVNHGTPRSPEDLMKEPVYRRAVDDRRLDVEQDYRRLAWDYYNEKKNRFVHLADGGLVDNQGLQSLLEEFEGTGLIRRRLNDDRPPLKRLILINVNAGTRPDDVSGRRSRAPGLRAVMLYTMVTSMDLLSAKRWSNIQEQCRQLYQPVLDGNRKVAFRDMEEPYLVEVSFRNLQDAERRRSCQHLPTSFKLTDEERALIDESAVDLVREDPAVVRLGDSLRREFADAPQERAKLERFFEPG